MQCQSVCFNQIPVKFIFYMNEYVKILLIPLTALHIKDTSKTFAETNKNIKNITLRILFFEINFAIRGVS